MGSCCQVWLPLLRSGCPSSGLSPESVKIRGLEVVPGELLASHQWVLFSPGCFLCVLCRETWLLAPPPRTLSSWDLPAAGAAEGVSVLPVWTLLLFLRLPSPVAHGGDQTLALGLVPALSGLRSFGQPRPRLSSPAFEQDEGHVEPRAPAPTAKAAKFQTECIQEGFCKVSHALTTFRTDWAQCIHSSPTLSWGLSKAWDLLGTVLVAS